MNEAVDVAIIGAGPAGLTAAIYAARFHLRVTVIDAGESRAASIPCTRNHAGFPDGVSGRELLARMGAQADRFGVARRADAALTLARDGEWLIAGSAADHSRRAGRVSEIRYGLLCGLLRRSRRREARICALAEAEMKATDSTTGEFLAGAVDQRAGGMGIKGAASFQWGDAENVMDYWAKRINDRLMELQGRTPPQS